MPQQAADTFGAWHAFLSRVYPSVDVEPNPAPSTHPLLPQPLLCSRNTTRGSASPSIHLHMRALNGTGIAPPSSVFFSWLPVMQPPPPLLPTHARTPTPTHTQTTQHNPPKSLVFLLAFSCFQKPSKMENKKVRWDSLDAGVIALARDRM